MDDVFFFFSSRRRHTRSYGDWSSDVCSSDLRQAFARWDFISMDFDKVPIEKGDFVYADPPYDVEFTQYSKEGFGWDDQVRLVDSLSAHSGPVVLSNQATGRIVRLYEAAGFKLLFVQAPRRISCTGDRTPAREV